MRPQQNRRMRGRGNNNNNNSRRGPNPLTRNYESNGPDVKIRGNAQHVADKYMTLARDAQASGDRIMAENYLQHAEHYMRIILSAQAQNPQPVARDEHADDENDDNGNVVELSEVIEAEPAGSGPQPVIEGTPAEVVLGKDAALEAGSDNEEVAERPRRAPRRRMPRQVAKPVATEGDDEAPVAKKAAPAKVVSDKVDAEVASEASDGDVEAKPRRRRRVVKAEPAEQTEA